MRGEDQAEGLRQVEVGKAFPAKTRVWSVVLECSGSGWNHRNAWGLGWAEKAGGAPSCEVLSFHFLLKSRGLLKDFKHTFRFAIWKAPLGQELRLRRGLLVGVQSQEAAASRGKVPQ